MASRYNDGSSGDSTPAQRPLEVCATSFYDEALAIHHTFDGLTEQFRTLRALSARLAVLHPNDLSTPTLALHLRDALLATAKRLHDVDGAVFDLWADEERVRTACENGTFTLRGGTGVLVGGSQASERAERGDEVDGVVRRFGRRVKEITREARGEAKDRRKKMRRDGGDGDEPTALGDYLEDGAYDFPHLLTKDTVHASRWVVENPFTILLRMTDDFRSLKIPHLVKTDATPATFVPPPSPPPLYRFSPASHPGGTLSAGSLVDNPTPAGVSSSGRRLPDWKSAILAEAAQNEALGKQSRSHRFFDELALELKEGAREIHVATGRGHRERWIIFLIIALFPVLLVANLVEDLFLSPRNSSTSTGPSEAGGSLSLRTPAPTMLAEQKRSVVTSAVGRMRDEQMLRGRRRRSAEFDAAVV